MMESVMEHIAIELGRSPIDVRIANMDPIQNERIIEFMKQLQTKSDYDKRAREIEQFNSVTTYWLSLLLHFERWIVLGKSVDQKGNIDGAHDIPVAIF